MGFIHANVGRIGIEERTESFIIHPNYGYTPDGNEDSDDLGRFGQRWREGSHPEFLLDDLDDLIAALQNLQRRVPPGRVSTLHRCTPECRVD